MLIVSQSAELLADHTQLFWVVTETVRFVGSAEQEAAEAASEKVQGTPDWLTVKAWPAMVIVALRGLALVFAATEKLAVPLPDPAFPELMVIQETGLEALHAQLFEEAVTVTEPFVGSDGYDIFAGFMEKVQGGGGVRVVALATLEKAELPLVLYAHTS